MPCSSCGVEKHFAKGLCKKCYQNAWGKTPKGRITKHKEYIKKLQRNTTDILEAQENKDDPEKLSAEFILSTIKHNAKKD